MVEQWDIYDQDRKRTGKVIERGMKLPEDAYHLVVQVWIQNDFGKWLISKRSKNKSYPLRWEPTGGSVLAGEESIEGALREVKEELGVCLDKQNGKLFASFRRERYSWENPGFLDVWVFKANIADEEIRLQTEETCDAKWASSQEIITMINNGDFIPMEEYPYYNELFSAN